jgi:alpha-1,6-mannosyltransferase
MAKGIVGCGLVLLVSLVTASRLDARADSETFVLLIGMAGIAYIATLFIVSRGLRSRRLLVVCLLLAVSWRVAIIPAAPLLSDDVYRYLWDGRVQRFGYNPYESTPNDPELAHLHGEYTRRIDPSSAALPTIYPPAAELFFRAVNSLSDSVIALVIAVVVCDLFTILLLWYWLTTTGRSPWWVLAYAWHPLVAIEGAGGGHIDLVGTFLVVAAGFALSRHRRLIAASVLAAAFAIKFLPIVLTPLFWKRVNLKDGVAALGLVGLVYLPFLDTGFSLPVGSLGTYLASWRFNGPIFGILAPRIGALTVSVIAVTVGLVVAAVARKTMTVDDPSAWAWPMAASLLLMPVVYPWYLVWLTPFLITRRVWPLTAWTLVSILTYVVWSSQLAGTGWVLPDWVVAVEYGLIVVVALWVWSRGTERASAFQ